MATKAKRTPMTIGLNLREAQDQAATLLRKARKQVDDLLPAVPRKRLAQFEARLERATKGLEKARTRAVRDARTRVEAFLGDVEKTAVSAVKPFVARLDLASKTDIDRLRKRITELEKRVAHKPHHESAAAH